MIPKVIHYCWFGGNPIPAELQGYMSSWKKIMPDYEIKLWNEDNYDVNKCAYMKEAYEAKKWGFVPDYARLDILYTYGGIYLDTDVEAVKRFDDLLELEGFCGFEVDKNKNARYSNLGLGLGCIAGQRMIKIIRDSYDNMHFRNPDGSLNLVASPELNSRLLKSYGFQSNNMQQNINGLTIFPAEYFCPMDQFTGKLNITPNTYSIHHYSSTWMSQADRERRELRRKYSFLGLTGSNIVSSLIAYRKHYGIIRMWREIFKKLVK